MASWPRLFILILAAASSLFNISMLKCFVCPLNDKNKTSPAKVSKILVILAEV